MKNFKWNEEFLPDDACLIAEASTEKVDVEVFTNRYPGEPEPHEIKVKVRQKKAEAFIISWSGSYQYLDGSEIQKYFEEAKEMAKTIAKVLTESE